MTVLHSNGGIRKNYFTYFESMSIKTDFYRENPINNMWFVTADETCNSEA